MTFARSLLIALCLAGLLAAVAPRIGRAPKAAAQQPPWQLSSSAPAPVKTQQAYSLPPDKLAKAIALSRIRNILDIVGSLWGLAVLWLILDTRLAVGLAAWAERIAKKRWLQGLLFFAVVIVLLTLTGLPLDIFSHQLNRSYGISVQGWGSWVGDQAKSLGLSLLFGTPVLLLFNWIVRRWPRRYWLGLWVAVLPLLVAGVFLSPLLDPIFNHFEPLVKSHPALVAELEKVVARTGTNIPPDRMFLMQASAKTNGLNAYVTGIGATKRFVMWDTAIDHLPDDEIMFVFGHESGHYVLNHIPRGMAISAFILFFSFWACAGFANWLVRRFGARWRLSETAGAPSSALCAEGGNPAPLSTRAGFVALLFAISLAGFILEPVDNTISRHTEHEADVYGQEAIHGLVPDPQKTAVSAFNHLGEAWLEDPEPSPFIEFWLYNHPSVQTCATFAANYNPWANGGHGKFFDK